MENDDNQATKSKSVTKKIARIKDRAERALELPSSPVETFLRVISFSTRC